MITKTKKKNWWEIEWPKEPKPTDTPEGFGVIYGKTGKRWYPAPNKVVRVPQPTKEEILSRFRPVDQNQPAPKRSIIDEFKNILYTPKKK
jgi:hypothetical protein